MGLGRHSIPGAVVSGPLKKVCSGESLCFENDSLNRPEKDIRENATYNYHLSSIRVRSEHCVGFLKGRWSSLRGLRLQINSARHVQVASLWVISCITLHCFAMRHKSRTDMTTNEFFQEGIRWLEESRDEDNNQQGIGEEDNREGRKFREELKGRLYEEISV